MDANIRQEFDAIRTLLHATETSFNRRMDRAEQRMERAEERMEKFDRRIEATRKLVEAGMKIVVRLGQSQEELRKSQKAFLDSLRKGGNGHRHST